MDPAREISRARRSGKLAKAVARELLNAISEGGYQAGDRLGSEKDLLERLGVGRGTLREALRILEFYGVITLRSGPGGGLTVDSIDGRDFGITATFFLNLIGATYAEVVEARLVMDPVMARLAAERRGPEALSRMRRTLDRAQDLDANDQSLSAVSAAFHREVAGMSSNRVLSLYGQGLMEVYAIRFPERLSYPAEMQARFRSVHESIGCAIFEGDGDVAERLMRSHMEEFLEFIRGHYPSILEETVEWL